KAPKGQSRVERLRKKMNEQESWLLLHSPTIPFRIHNKHGKVLTSSCFKLRTVHNIPVTSNKDGSPSSPPATSSLTPITVTIPGRGQNTHPSIMLSGGGNPRGRCIVFCSVSCFSLILFICVVLQEFEIELEGSQYLRILCYEKCYDKSMLNKDDNEIVDKIMGKGQVQVRGHLQAGCGTKIQHVWGPIFLHVTHFNELCSLSVQ
ncbi:hypothetical protein GOODEAATRI_006987, partial [Goodea atripinnis]